MPEINALDLINVLRSKHVDYLYHANSVRTALTYVKNSGLLSRGAVDLLGEVQTSQYTDKIDKRFGVWNDIFFDAVDIHDRINNVNKYGPILFVYKLSVLQLVNADCIRLIRLNPTHWNDNTTEDQRFYQSINDFDLNYARGDFNTHVTLHNFNEPLLFKDHLEMIIIDNVNMAYKNENVGSSMLQAIRNSVIVNCPEILGKVHLRQCRQGCKCHQTYLEMPCPRFEELLLL